ncbi:hypothetical protein BDZ89DRAFT_1161769 [Hymenopellis radicata]|nr:hypothetical protein BDZ89DRAFT_1161769 [Hymenopellis radicata]
MLPSTVAYEGHVGQVAYAGSKGAIRAMTLLWRASSRGTDPRRLDSAGLFTTAMTEQFQGEMRDFLIHEGRSIRSALGAGGVCEDGAVDFGVRLCEWGDGQAYGGTRVPVKL